MACAGTLSWSVAGLVAPKVPIRRKGHPMNQERFAGTPSKLDQAPRKLVQDHGQEAKPMTPDTRQTSGPLEIDWSQVVRRCMDGDSGAWAELVRTHHRRVYGLCYRFTGNPADAEDLTQDVFLKIYSNLASFDMGRGSLQVWITTMTRNLLVDNFRRTRNQRATGSLDEGWDVTDELRPIDRLTSSSPSPHENAAKKELAKMVQDALAQVSVELREAVISKRLTGYGLQRDRPGAGHTRRDRKVPHQQGPRGTSAPAGT